MITIILNGKVKQKEIAQLCDTYQKRIKTFAGVRLKILFIEQNYEERIEKLAEKGGHQLFLLTEDAKEYTSHEFTKLLTPHFESGQAFTLVIGPPEGFSDTLKETLPTLSLSQMTFPHDMATMLLLEQIYRACCLHYGKDYHK